MRMRADRASPRSWLRNALDRFLLDSGCQAGLLVDLDAPFIGPESVAGHGFRQEPWIEAVRHAELAAEAPAPSGRARSVFLTGRTEAGQATVVSLHGDQSRWRILTVSVTATMPSASVRAAIAEALERPSQPLHPMLAMIESIGDHTGLPLGLLERRQITWANLPLWRSLGLDDGVQLGFSFANPRVLLASSRLEAAARGELPLRGFVLTDLPSDQLLVQVANPEARLRTTRIDSLVRRLRLTPKERHELGHLLRGRTSKEAAELDGISTETIRERRQQIYRKAGVKGAGPLRALLDGVE